MKIASEIVGIFIISLVMMAIPILCTLSFAYNWFVEWIGLMSLIMNASDKKD